MTSEVSSKTFQPVHVSRLLDIIEKALDKERERNTALIQVLAQTPSRPPSATFTVDEEQMLLIVLQIFDRLVRHSAFDRHDLRDMGITSEVITSVRNMLRRQGIAEHD
jgi:hypothetical protein